MAYNSAIPQATDRISQSQLDLLNNFIEINTLVGVNHVGFNVADQGKHNFIQIPTAVPSKTTAAAEVALYSNNDATTGNPALFFQKQSLAADSGYSFTEYENTANSSAVAGAATILGNAPGKGWTRLPSGILMKWGRGVATTSNRLYDVTAISGGPAFTQALFAVQLTDNGNTVTVHLGTVQTVAPWGFNASASANTNFSFLCIGI